MEIELGLFMVQLILLLTKLITNGDEIREIQLVNLINDQSCVHACGLDGLGKPIEEYWEKISKSFECR